MYELGIVGSWIVCTVLSYVLFKVGIAMSERRTGCYKRWTRADRLKWIVFSSFFLLSVIFGVVHILCELALRIDLDKSANW